MSFIGEIQNGHVVFPSPIPLANGTRVRVEQLEAPQRVREKLERLLKDTQALPQIQALTDEEIAAEVAAHRSG